MVIERHLQGGYLHSSASFVGEVLAAGIRHDMNSSVRV